MSQVVYITIYIIVGVVILIGLVYLYRYLTKNPEPEIKPKFTEQELEFIQDRLPSRDNFIPISLNTIVTDMKLASTERMLLKLEIDKAIFLEKVRDISGNSGGFDLVPGFSLNHSKRKIKSNYVRTDADYDTLLISSKRLILDSDDNSFRMTLDS